MWLFERSLFIHCGNHHYSLQMWSIRKCALFWNETTSAREYIYTTLQWLSHQQWALNFHSWCGLMENIKIWLLKAFHLTTTHDNCHQTSLFHLHKHIPTMATIPDMIKDTALTEFLWFPWAVCVKAPGLDATKLKASSELINAYYLLHF